MKKVVRKKLYAECVELDCRRQCMTSHDLTIYFGAGMGKPTMKFLYPSNSPPACVSQGNCDQSDPLCIAD